MQLKIHENIKKYRKAMGLTQEELAEVFGVTVGAVSKWESGSTIPDIITLTELADFFDVSVDALLGYSTSSKNLDDAMQRMESLMNQGKYDEAIRYAEKILVRYPGSFRVLTGCADTYTTVYAVKSFRKEYRDRAVELLKEALRYADQSTGSRENEMTIRYRIAELKTRENPLESIREFEKINYRGAAEIALAQAFYRSGDKEKTKDHYTRALVSILVHSIEYATGMLATLVEQNTPEAYQESSELMDWCMALMEVTSNGQTGYPTKVMSMLLALKAACQSCLGDHERMKESLDQALVYAKEYDKNPSNAFADKIRFWHAGEDFHPPAYDNLGHSAVEGIGKLLDTIADSKDPSVSEKILEGKKYWEQIST